MNWSTRLRRWVRIRMPPVREASMKPTAATVLPAPVACSNQKRRLAPGSSRTSAPASSSSSGSSSQSIGSSSGARSSSSSATGSSSSSSSSGSLVVVLVLELLVGLVGLLDFGLGLELEPPRRTSSGPGPGAVGGDSTRSPSSSVIRAARVPDRASTWWGFSSAPSARCGVSSESTRSRPSISEYSLRHSIDGVSRPSSISASAASRAMRRALPGTRSFSFSPSSRKGSRANSLARSTCAPVGAFAAFAAT